MGARIAKPKKKKKTKKNSKAYVMKREGKKLEPLRNSK